ncbi:hypothetical protein COCCADRAFT_98754 [Bipolaris zeicola 26-R-13]|uniref:CHAT domain-containing protein n=1 Tax=Cochliobolus carbonum (strain 26-R-13) TaxID=930089 RepID=W6Y379_COCC2|nr:uncharacterized protein COCCADRAFT_98754 [Bipolaris zeicola 26-R-13]EUC32388.1 hypothetical protein COCCADRAFT_98754 [Bipolaris zeicola 26-R-13]
MPPRPTSFSGPSVIKSRSRDRYLAFVATETRSVTKKVSQTLDAATSNTWAPLAIACMNSPCHVCLPSPLASSAGSFSLAAPLFRFAIFTLWEVQDEYCVDNARIFYETLRDEGISDDVVTTTDGSQTVNETSIDLGGDNKASITSNMRTAELVSRLAKQGNKLHPHYWAPYVHFGL